MDAISLLRKDHKTVEQLFKRFEKSGDRAHVEKRQIADRIIEELSVHAAIEEQVFYPVARATVPGTEDVTLESLEEHRLVKWLLSELADLDPADERFDAKVTVLIEIVRHHVEEEEGELFPKVRDELGRAALKDVGESLAVAKMSAPIHPHPRSPDVPPANVVVGAVAGVMDRVGDNISGIAQGGVLAAQDLIARILHTKKRRPAPTGSTVARTRARNVRRAASGATGGAQRTARSVKSGTTSAAKAASSAAKKKGSTAGKASRSAATTAKKATTPTARTSKAATTNRARTTKRAASRNVAAAKRAR